MPSSNKTGHLQLNKWLGSDKPKKDDFNADNVLVDDACRKMNSRIQALEDGGSLEVLEALSAHTGNSGIHVTPTEKSSIAASGSAIASHTANADIHVTAAEKAAWNSPPTPTSSMVIGTYTGDGSYSRAIPLGFRPKFGFLYAVDRAPIEGDWSLNQIQYFAGFFGTYGSGKFLGVDSNGIVVRHTVTTPGDGLVSRYNMSGVHYVYVVWPE